MKGKLYCIPCSSLIFMTTIFSYLEIYNYLQPKNICKLLKIQVMSLYITTTIIFLTYQQTEYKFNVISKHLLETALQVM